MSSITVTPPKLSGPGSLRYLQRALHVQSKIAAGQLTAELLDELIDMILDRVTDPPDRERAREVLLDGSVSDLLDIWRAATTFERSDEEDPFKQ